MDVTTVVGLVLAFVLLGWSLSAGGSDVGLFVDAPSMTGRVLNGWNAGSRRASISSLRLAKI